MAITEIYIGLRDNVKDKSGAVPVKVYQFEDITPEEAEKLCEEFLTNPITEVGEINKDVGRDNVEIGFKPGVMNPVEGSLYKASDYLKIKPKAVGTSRVYFYSGNKLPSNITVSQVEEVIRDKRETLVLDTEAPAVEIIQIRSLKDDDLAKLSKDRSLFLDQAEMKAIQNHFNELGREPTDVELEILAQTWSEHNGHKTFKAELVTPNGEIKKSAIQRLKEVSEKHFDRAEVVTAFKDNSGGIRFYNDYAIIVKVETHNHPSSVHPEGGAETGIGGVQRDIVGTGKGGKNLFAIVINNFGQPNLPKDQVNDGCLHPQDHLKGVIKGQSSYGNQMGVPTLMMALHFDKDFSPKPTVMGGAIGIIEEENVEKGEPQIGDLLIKVGGRTGKDGIHGATSSSGEMTTETNILHATSVQMGNAIEQKIMFDALEKCKDAGLIRALTDLGGGGLSSAVGEMAEKIGVEVNLDRVLLKYKGLAPWEIFLSESQEGMIVAIDPKNWEEFKNICDIYETPATAIGTFTGDKMLRLKYAGEVVGELSMDFLHNGIPKRRLNIIYEKRQEKKELPDYPKSLLNTYKAVLGHLNICSKESFFRKYDHTVGGRTVLSPLMGINQDVMPDAAVVRPLRGKPYGVITSCALNPTLMRIDSYEGTIWTFAQVLAKYVSVGGDVKNMAALDNYVWPSNTAYTLGALDRSIDALALMLDVFEVPIVSGKDSMSGTFRKKDGTIIEIPYTLNITLFGKIPDVAYAVTPEFKKPGSMICLVGANDLRQMGGSIYLDTQKKVNTDIPQVNLHRFPKTLEMVQNAIQQKTIKSCKAVGEGGLAVALSQMCFASRIGAQIDLGVFNTRPDFAFFSENPCFLVEINTIDDAQAFKGVPYKIIGTTSKNPIIRVVDQFSTLFEVPIEELRKAGQWKY